MTNDSNNYDINSMLFSIIIKFIIRIGVKFLFPKNLSVVISISSSITFLSFLPRKEKESFNNNLFNFKYKLYLKNFLSKKNPFIKGKRRAL